jgi:ribonucleotide reductase alpha subunit
MSEYILATNPCITGDTLISVADGRGAVPIKTLAEEGKDVPVYCLNEKGEQVLSIMRNPRITGYDKKIYEVTLDDGNKIKCTGNHKFYINDGAGNIVFKEAKDLVEGDSVVVKDKFLTCRGKDTFYWHTRDGIHYGDNAEHSQVFYLYGKNKPGGYHIHHKDFNSLNNSITNLELVRAKEHRQMHMNSDNNPMRDKWWSTATKEERKHYHEVMSKAVSGLKNGNAHNITNEELREIIKAFIMSKGRPVFYEEYKRFALANNLPSQDSGKKFRNLHKTISEVAIELGLSNEILESNWGLKKSYITYLNAKNSTDLKLFFNEETGEITVEKICETCGKIFNVSYYSREVSFCSNACVLKSDMHKKGAEKGRRIKNQNLKKLREENKLKFDNLICKFICENKILPNRLDLVDICKNNNLSDLRTLGYPKITDFYNDLFKKYGVNLRLKSFIKSEVKRKELAKQLMANGLTFNHKVIAVQEVGTATVYNGTVDKYHNYGIVIDDFDLNVIKTGMKLDDKTTITQVFTKNCGEEPLIDGASCNLSSINLTQFVIEPFTNKASFDFDTFKETVRYMVVALDKILDQNHYPLDKQKLTVELKRLVGLGVTGLGDMFAMLKIKYSSKEALQLADKIVQTMFQEAYKVGIDLAKVFGPFKEWELFTAEDNKKFVEGPFLSKLTEQTKQDILKYGVRNSRYLTIAPTGTTSLIMNNVSGGVEPIFSVEYDRKVKRSSEETTTETIRTYSWALYNKLNKGTSEIPDYFETTDDLKVDDHLNMQAVFQNYICASISKTINVPVDYPFEEYIDIFIKAHKLGLKGCTTYRPNEIIGSVLSKTSDKLCSDNKRPVSIIPNCAPKRPKDLPCDIIQTSIKGEMWTVLISLLDDCPYEIFCGSTEDLYLPKSCKCGIVRKQGGGKYELEVVIRRSPVVYKDLASILMDDDQKAMTRLLSLSLRHGVLPRYIVEQLKKSNGNITAFSTAISRVLSKYIGTYNLKEGENKCPSCGEPTLIFSEGCIKCSSCAYSRCG